MTLPRICILITACWAAGCVPARNRFILEVDCVVGEQNYSFWRLAVLPAASCVAGEQNYLFWRLAVLPAAGCVASEDVYITGSIAGVN